MRQILWNITVDSLPAVIRYCKKCSRKTRFLCSERFRINAQQRNLDIWMIYKCAVCDTTWNAEIYARISPQKLDNALLERFHRNDTQLAKTYALDMQFLSKNLVQPEEIEFTVNGASFDPDDEIQLLIQCEYPLPIRVSRILRRKLGISQKEYLHRVESGQIRSVPEKDLKKCRLGKELTIIFMGKSCALRRMHSVQQLIGNTDFLCALSDAR